MIDFNNNHPTESDFDAVIESIAPQGEMVEVPEEYVYTVATVAMKVLLGMGLPNDRIMVSVHKEKPVVKITYRASKLAGSKAWAQETDCAAALHILKKDPDEVGRDAAIRFERALSEELGGG